MELKTTITRPADTTAYTAGDVVGDAAGAAAMVFPVSSRPGGGSTHLIEQALLIDGANVATKGDFDLFLFDALVVPVADNAAFAPTDTEMLSLVGVITFTGTGSKVGNATAGDGGNCSNQVDCSVPFNAEVPALYGVLVARNGYIPVSGEVFKLRLALNPAR